MRYIEKLLSSPFASGGRHAAMGTCNRILNLGHGIYLEVIAIDPTAPPPAWPRWFGLDDPNVQARLKTRPRLVAWVARTGAIDGLIKNDHGIKFQIRPMQRGVLRWQFAFTEDGRVPCDGLLPHLIQWEGAAHPTAAIPSSTCRLAELMGGHPQPMVIQKAIDRMGLEASITIRPADKHVPAGLSARIDTSDGEVVLD